MVCATVYPDDKPDPMTRRHAGALLAATAFAAVLRPAPQPDPGVPLSPIAIAPAPDGQSLWIACASARQVLRFDPVARRVTVRIALPGPPTGLAVAPSGDRLYVTCATPVSQVAVIDAAASRIAATLAAGHTAGAPVLSPDGRRLYVCNRFNNDVSFIDLASRRTLRRVAVEREPVAAALSRDGRFLFVANLLHAGRADAAEVAAAVSVIDSAGGRVVRTIRLPNGSGSLMDVKLSPDGRYAAVTHVLGRFTVPTTQLERGWMNTNAVSLIDAVKLERVATILLDGPQNGAANPWGLAWSPGARYLLATHAGAHEVSVIDWPGLLARLAQLPARPDPGKLPQTLAASDTRADLANDLSFLTGLRRLVSLDDADRGPRSIAVAGNRAYAANYFSDTLVAIDLEDAERAPESLALGPTVAPDLVRRGEEHFHDASLCFQRWQSCATCHPGDARTDGLNWDLLNDGIGNPKKTKSMLLSHQTPPAMSTGVRETAETAVRSGFQHIQFTRPPGSVTAAVDAYLQSLQPAPSPRLVNGGLSESARRGRGIFRDRGVGCARCHPEGLFTDLRQYDVGTTTHGDGKDEQFDTPTLVEVWRTAPYLHDGSAATMKDVFTTRNRGDRHGKTSHLSPAQLADLIEYVLSL
jgi:YVTN family beta-propeller protein